MDIKPTLLLAMALFLVSAPDPDSRAIAEMTGHFIVPSDERALQAAELENSQRRTSETQHENHGEITESPNLIDDENLPLDS